MKLALGGGERNNGIIYVLLGYDDFQEQAELKLKESGEFRSIVWSPNSKLLVYGGSGKALQLWDMENYKQLAVFQGGNKSSGYGGVSFHPNGKLLASGDTDDMVCLWDVEKRQFITALKGHVGGPVACVSFSPDGKRLASAGGQAIFLWEKQKVSTSVKSQWILKHRFENSSSLFAGNTFLKGSKNFLQQPSTFETTRSRPPT